MIKPPYHQLKIWPEFYRAVIDGRKRFEIREDDRGFAVGQLVCLEEFDHLGDGYTGRSCLVEITYLTSWAQQENHVVFGFEFTGLSKEVA